MYPCRFLRKTSWDDGVLAGLDTASSACGWVLQVAWATASDGHPKRHDAVIGSVVLDSFHVTSAVEAELWGIELLTASLKFFCSEAVTVTPLVTQLFHSSMILSSCKVIRNFIHIYIYIYTPSSLGLRPNEENQKWGTESLIVLGKPED